MNIPRESNFDLLRIIATIAVIAIHASSPYIGAITSDSYWGGVFSENIISTCFYNIIPRFAVPCFVMLSGAFLLDDKQNAEYKYFYGKAFKGIGITTLVFSAGYFVISEAAGIAGSMSVSGKISLSSIAQPIKSWMLGMPYYHMWYLYMLVGIYLLTPVIIRFKKDIGESCFRSITWVFLIAACLSAWTSSHKLKWDIGLSFCYIGYFMVGYTIRLWMFGRKNNIRGSLLIAAGVAVEFIVIALRYQQAIARIADEDLEYSIAGNYSPLIVLASLLIFTGFSLLKINKNMGRLAALTSLIYLFHGGIMNIYYSIVKYLWGLKFDSKVVIPTAIVLVFFISLILSIAYQILWSSLDRRLHITEQLCKILHLNNIQYSVEK